MIENLIQILHDGNHSLVVANNDIRTFDGMGVSDLLRLLKEDDGFLRGASVADKVIGKAAAGLMIYGDVKEVYGDTVSTSAIELFHENGIALRFNKKVPYIINRAGDGWCPMEKACYELHSVDDIYHTVHSFVSSVSKKNNS